jgi:hypothetical protein
MKPITTIAEPNFSVRDVVTPSGGIFPLATLYRCETYTGLNFDSSSIHTEIPSGKIPDLSGGASRQATFRLYLLHANEDHGETFVY